MQTRAAAIENVVAVEAVVRAAVAIAIGRLRRCKVALDGALGFLVLLQDPPAVDPIQKPLLVFI